jgi:hypothetical protein
MIRYVFVREWYAIKGGQLTPELLIQVDDHTFRRLTADELVAFDEQYPGTIGQLRRMPTPVSYGDDDEK